MLTALLVALTVPGEPLHMPRYERIAGEAACILIRFPNKETTDANIEMAERHLAWLNRQMALWPYNLDFYAARDEAEAVLTVWTTLRTVHQEPAMVWQDVVRMEAVLSYADFCAGRMPPPVPIKRFRRAD
jgi:hypothetical protein